MKRFNCFYWVSNLFEREIIRIVVENKLETHTEHLPKLTHRMMASVRLLPRALSLPLSAVHGTRCTRPAREKLEMEWTVSSWSWCLSTSSMLYAMASIETHSRAHIWGRWDGTLNFNANMLIGWGIFIKLNELKLNLITAVFVAEYPCDRATYMHADELFCHLRSAASGFKIAIYACVKVVVETELILMCHWINLNGAPMPLTACFSFISSNRRVR